MRIKRRELEEREGGKREGGREEGGREEREMRRRGRKKVIFLNVSALLHSEFTHFDLFLELSDPENGIPLLRRYLFQLTTIFVSVA